MADSGGQVISCSSETDLDHKIQNGFNSNKLVVVAFMDSRSGACRFIGPYLMQLANRMQPSVLVLRVDVDELSSVAEKWSVVAKPTFKIMKSREDKTTVVGAKKYLLQQTIIQKMPNN